MSLYNMLFGMNTSADVILKCLNLDRGDFGRFRDCFIAEDDDLIVVHTRTGGGNRECYEDTHKELESHPNYSHDEDDDFDCTYANFYFTFPDEYKDDLNLLKSPKEPDSIKPSKKWLALLDSMKPPAGSP